MKRWTLALICAFFTQVVYEIAEYNPPEWLVGTHVLLYYIVIYIMQEEK